MIEKEKVRVAPTPQILVYLNFLVPWAEQVRLCSFQENLIFVNFIIKFYNSTNESPRQFNVEFWIMKERTIILAHMSIKTTHKKVTFQTYSYSKHEGQINITKRFMKNKLLAISSILNLTAVTKYLTPVLIQQLYIVIEIDHGCNFDSKRVNKNWNINGSLYIDRNAGIMKEVTNKLAYYSVNNGLHYDTWEFIFLTCTLICIADAMNLHNDEPRSHLLKGTELRGNNRFVETRKSLKINLLSNLDKIRPPLGCSRGGLEFIQLCLLIIKFLFTRILMTNVIIKLFKHIMR